MNHPKHQKYKLLSNYDNYGLVQDVLTGEEHRCFPLDYHEIGDEFYLYIKTINIHTGYIEFAYSILNLYEENKTYAFDILELRDTYMLLSNFDHLRFAAPLQFLENKEARSIDLEVKALNLDKNRLIFKNKTSSFKGYDDIAEMDFERGRVYDLKVIDAYTNNNGTRFAILEDRGKKLKTNLPSALNEVDLDPEIPFLLGHYEDGTPTLNATREYVTAKLYEIGEPYTFKIVKQNYNSENGTSYWSLIDGHGMYNHYYPDSDLTAGNEIDHLEEGDEMQLYVSYFTDHGYLHLVSRFIEVEEAKYLVADLFEQIGYPGGEDEFFFTDGTDVEKATELSEDRSYSYIDQYNEGENLWIFTYLSFLDEDIFDRMEEGAFEEAKIRLDIYVKIEKWVLEDSDYLINFSRDKQEGIIQKAETKIKRYKATIKAIDLFLNNEDQGFIENIRSRLTTSPYLSDKKKTEFKALVRVSQYFLADSEDDQIYEVIILLLQNGIVDKEDYLPYIKSTESKIKRVRDKVLEAYANKGQKDDEADLELLIRNQYLLVILNFQDNNDYRATLSGAQLLRYLAIFYKERRFLDLGINLLTNKAYLKPNIFNQSSILALDFAQIEKMMVYPEKKPTYLKDAGLIKFTGNDLRFIPANLAIKGGIPTTVAAIESLNLSIESDVFLNDVSRDQERGTLLKNTFSAIRYNRYDHTVNEAVIDYDKVYTGRVKAFGYQNKYCFVEFVIDGKIEEVLFHPSNFNRSLFITDVSKYLKIGDKVNFVITDYKEGRFEIAAPTLPDQLDEAPFAKNDKALAYISRKHGGLNVAIAENGWPVSFYEPSTEVGEVYEVEIDHYDSENHNYNAGTFQLTDEGFREAPDRLWRDYFIETDLIVDDTGTTAEEGNDFESVYKEDRGLRNYAAILIYCLEQRLNYITSEKERILHYYFLITISGIIRHRKSYLYTAKLEHMKNAIRLKEDKDFSALHDLMEDKDIRFKELEGDKKAVELLGFLNTDFIEVPVPLNPTSRFFNLKKLIETYNLFKSFDKEHKLLGYFKKLIANAFYNIVLKKETQQIEEFEAVLADDDEEEKEKRPASRITNLGSESKTREFKSSFFYSASDEPQDKVILRTIAGFLNAYEGIGHLYIGVNDSGEIIGLERDLNYSKNITNLDQYQNHIQSRIVGAFPKVINASIDFEFHRSRQKDYLEIIVPSYNRPISFENEFYQRQGVQVRILKGADLLDFTDKKRTVLGTKLNTASETGQQSANTVSAHNGIIRNQEEVTDKTEKYETSGSEEKEITQTLEEPGEDNTLIAYFYLFGDGTYMISPKSVDDYLHKVPITETYQSGHLLLCYDNGCVNKVEIDTILDRTFYKRYKNALNKQGELKAVLLSRPGDEIVMSIAHSGQTYIKIFETDKISAHRLLRLKGNCIVQNDYDYLENYAIGHNLPDKFDAFRRASKQNIGVERAKLPGLHEQLLTFLNNSRQRKLKNS